MKMIDEEYDVCHICNLLVAKDQHGILCEQCKTWIHHKCISMSLRQCSGLKNLPQGWFCNRCLQKSPN